MTSFSLMLPSDYLLDLCESVKNSKERIDIITLVFFEDEATKELVDALCDASERGVHVSVGLDLYFTYKEIGANEPRWNYIRAQVKRMRATRKKLVSHGVKVRWLGQGGLTFFSQRTHIKWSVVDGTVYSFGGVNLYAEGIANNDYIFKTTDIRLAERLAGEHDLVINTDKAGRAYPSHYFSIDQHTVLIDGGRFFDSIIYRRVCHYASQAKHVIYVSQYCPTNKLSRLLKRTDTDFYFNHWQNADDNLNRILIRVSSFVHRIKPLYTKKQYLHAKFMIFTMPDGSEIAITGSHNFVAGGAMLGTREVALETSDPTIIEQLKSFLTEYIMPPDEPID